MSRSVAHLYDDSVRFHAALDMLVHAVPVLALSDASGHNRPYRPFSAIRDWLDRDGFDGFYYLDMDANQEDNHSPFHWRIIVRFSNPDAAINFKMRWA